MSALIYLMTVSVLLAEYLQLEYDLPNPMRWLPEACSLIAALVVVLQMQGRNLGKVDARYLFVFGLILVGMLLSVRGWSQISPTVGKRRAPARKVSILARSRSEPDARCRLVPAGRRAFSDP